MIEALLLNIFPNRVPNKKIAILYHVDMKFKEKDLKIPHKPILTDEIVEIFKNIENGYIVDCTVGYGGHTKAILEKNKNIKMICIDQDSEAIEFSKQRLKEFKDRVIFVKGRFSQVINSYKDFPIKGILADIGVSSLQLDCKNRGFGFKSNVLDMRMDKTQKLSAKDVINSYSLHELEEIFKNYGEVKEFKKIASLIVKQREIKPFESANELADFIADHVIAKRKIHPATLIFQAIRIEVNDELGELERLLNSIKNLNIPKCLVAIISFHSLEDRVVKQVFKKWQKSCICHEDVLRCICGNNHSIGKVLTKKPIVPKRKEIEKNPRSRSAKLRVFSIEREKF